MGPIAPHLSFRSISSQPIELGNCFSVKHGCVVGRKEDDVEVTGTNLASVEFFIEFKCSTESDPFHSPKLPKACNEGNQSSAQQSAETSEKPDKRFRMPFNQSP